MRNTILGLSVTVFGVLSSLASECSAQQRQATRFLGSYEAAMRVPVSYDFLHGASAEGLGAADVEGPLTRAIPQFVRCVAQEQQRGRTLEQVRLRIAVGSDGRLMGLSVDQGSPGFRQCATRVVRALRWRAFSGPRMGFNWGFSVQ